MSILYFESGKTRFNNADDNENNRKSSTHHNQSSLPSSDSLASMFSSIKSDYKPKRPSNLVKPASSTSTSTITLDSTKLAELVSQSEANLNEASRSYDKHFEQFVELTRRFHTERLNNLMLTFKNQILKQQIYFETELFELCKECHVEFTSNKSKQTSSGKKSFMRFYQQEMKSLVEYMRESLVNSSDTLIDAYESCRVLRSLHHVENSFNKQNTSLKASTQALLGNRSNEKKTTISESEGSTEKRQDFKLTVLNEDEDEDQVNDDDQDNQESEYSKQIEKFQSEMNELMHTLDDIELQHLQRKELLYSQTKSLDKLRSKFKFIESKYVSLSKRVAGLKHESYLYKRLWYEKKRAESCVSGRQQFNSSDKASGVQNSSSAVSSPSSSSISPSNSSRTSSTCSMSDCDEDEEEILSHDVDTETTGTYFHRVEQISSNSDGSANNSTSSIQYDHNNSSYSSNDNQTNPDSSSSSDNDNDDTSSTSSCSKSRSNTSVTNNKNSQALSVKDYNRKMALIHELISFHKTRSMGNSANSNPRNTNCRRIIQEAMSQQNDQLVAHLPSTLSSSLDLSECSMEGDQVSVENCNLRQDRDISNWVLTRHVENMPTVSKYRFPVGSVINAGKVLRIDAPFHSDLLDLLLAVGKKRAEKASHSKKTTTTMSTVKVRIKTRLIAPDGSVKAIHTQETPQFYEEIFKYANLIHIF